MKITPQRLERPQSLLVQVEQALRRAIAEQAFPEGKLPTEVELAETFGVSRETVRRAADVLQREGLLTKYRRRGTLVRSETPAVTRLDSPLTTTAPIAYVQADYRTGDERPSDDLGDQATAGLGAHMLQGAIDEAGGDHARVGDDQRAPEPQGGRELAHALERAVAEDDARVRLEVEGDHDRCL